MHITEHCQRQTKEIIHLSTDSGKNKMEIYFRHWTLVMSFEEKHVLNPSIEATEENASIIMSELLFEVKHTLLDWSPVKYPIKSDHSILKCNTYLATI